VPRGFYEGGVWLLFFALLIPAGVVGWAIGQSGRKTVTVTVSAPPTAPAAIPPAPAFSTADLAATPSDNWVTNGGSLSNDRYTSLDQIDTSNVSKLKGVWMIHLHGDATAAKYSAESQPLEWNGVIYVPTGDDDVFAIDSSDGKVLWEYKAHLNQSISTVCCGWESRGVALGEGRVFVGQLDGKLVALDQRTGKVAWSTLVEPWQRGYSITSAPLYVDGMVITGLSGGEFGTRGRLTAYDAKTGRLRWRFWTVPGPGQPGHETWPNNDAWMHGGAPVWQTPAVDPKLGLIYFSTGNAGPDEYGGNRAGKNLYTASMLALDLKTGKLRWSYQMVHHDIWDYDAPSPVVLFDARIHGRTVRGIGEAEKTGWLYLLDRTTGKPLFPIPEKPVPQLARQKTFPTQPIPSYPSIVPEVITNAGYAQIVKAATQAAQGSNIAAKKVTVLRQTHMFQPYWHTMLALTPGPQGGTNWQPSSYSPKTHLMYVCAQSGSVGYTALTAKPAKQKNVAQITTGSTLTVAGGFGANPGYFAAVDVTTGRIAGEKRWTEACYAGSVATAGNVVFIGRNGGELQAYDASSGKQLWSFQTGAGANDAPTIFRRNGKEYVVFYAGGNALAATPHGDRLWLFGLDGTMGPAKPPAGGTGIEHAGATQGKNPTNAQGNAAAGKVVFTGNCSTCHGLSGHGGNGGPDLTAIPSAKNLVTVIGQVTNGGAGMPSFKGSLTQTQIRDVATYVVKQITHGP
jgi:alcohol dehydrogenase (cytochrome c)